MKTERKEGWFRILVMIVSGILLGLWSYVVFFVAFINFVVTVFSGKRHRALAEFCEPWNTESYKYVRYMSFMSNKKPFPFSGTERMSKYQ